MRMPTYEYECLKCKRVFEIRQRISEPALTKCDVCGGDVRRLLSAAPFILKGGGWYVTDYPSESRKKAIEAEKPPSSPSAPSAAKSEAKSDAKSSTSDSSSTKTSSDSSSSGKSSEKSSGKSSGSESSSG